MHALANLTLVENSTEAVENAVVCLRSLFGKERTDFAHETNRNLDTVIGGFFEKQNENFESEHLMNHPLIDEVGDEHCCRVAYSLVISLKGSAELGYETRDEQLADHRKFCVDDRRERSKDGRKGEGKGLSSHDGTAVKATAADEISASKELGYDALDVFGCNLVDETRDALLEGVPAHSLILDAAWIRSSSFCHERLQTRRRNVCPTGFGGRKLCKCRPQRFSFGRGLFGFGFLLKSFAGT